MFAAQRCVLLWSYTDFFSAADGDGVHTQISID